MLIPAVAGAQITDTTQTPVDSVVVPPEAEPTVLTATVDTILPITPRGAFLRSAVLPGWGQAALGSYVRGGVYFMGWIGNNYMLFRNQVRLDAARERYRKRVDQIRDDLIANAPDPDSMQAVLDSLPAVLDEAVRADDGPGNTGNGLRRLVESREQQREDWIAWSIFWVLASGLDGFVTAHLASFPATVELDPNPDRSVSIGVQVPLPVRRRR